MTKHTESHKVIVGLAIGTAIGVSALYCLKMARNRPTPVLHKIGKTIAEVGEMLENTNFGSCSDVAHKFESNAPKAADLLSNFMDWASTGMNLWKKFNKGR